MSDALPSERLSLLPNKAACDLGFKYFGFFRTYETRSFPMKTGYRNRGTARAATGAA